MVKASKLVITMVLETFGTALDGMMRGGGADGYGEMDKMNHNDNFNGYVKETHKDLTVICIQKNNGNATDGNVTKNLTCPECIEKFLSPSELSALDKNRLALPQFNITLAEYCKLFIGDNKAAIIAGLVGDFTETTPPIVLSAEKLQELAECIFKAINDRPHFPPRGY